MNSRTVLISDDNRSAADALCKFLRREGYDAHAVYDGQSAIDRIQAGGVEIVLTDLKMEPVDGMAVLRAAKAESDPPIVLVFTGYGTVETAVQAMHLGALYYCLAVLVVDIPPLRDRSPEALDDGFSLSRFLENQERRLLEQALRQTDGDRSEMSPLLGVERAPLRYKLNKHDLHDRT